MRFHGLVLMLGIGLAALVARHGAVGAMVQVKGWGLNLLPWFA